MRQKDPVLTFLLTFCVKTIRQRRIADSTEKKHKKMKQKVSIFFVKTIRQRGSLIPLKKEKNKAKSKYINLSIIFLITLMMGFNYFNNELGDFRVKKNCL